MYCIGILEKQTESQVKEIRRQANVGGNISSKSNNELSIKEQITMFRKEWETRPPHFDGKQAWVLDKCLGLTMRFAES